MNTSSKFGKDGKTPDPYTIEQMQHLMALGVGNEWEMIFVLSGLYGLRRNEALGLRWDNVDLKKKQFSVVEQLPFKMPPKTTTITEMAPTKSQHRVLPITDVKGALTHHPQASGGTACGSRALSEGGPAGGSFPAQYDRLADATGGLCIGRICVDALGAWGPSATNKLHRVYTDALLATTIRTYKKS